jgi:transcription elongation factor GreA
MSIHYYTKEGLEKLREELKHLESVQRPRISEQIAEARDKGDLSENAEYDAAKEAQGLLELQISKLKEIISSARVIDESQLDNSKVLILSKVKVRHKTLGKEFHYTLVSEKEADLASGRISIDSPIGKGLLGKKVGEVAEIKTPNGSVFLEVLEISRA